MAQDHKVALFLLRKSAEQGTAAAQLALGELYAEGLGIKQDAVQAYKWFKLAEMAGEERAATKLKAAETGMTPEQIEKAQSLAQQEAPKAK